MWGPVTNSQAPCARGRAKPSSAASFFGLEPVPSACLPLCAAPWVGGQRSRAHPPLPRCPSPRRPHCCAAFSIPNFHRMWWCLVSKWSARGGDEVENKFFRTNFSGHMTSGLRMFPLQKTRLPFTEGDDAPHAVANSHLIAFCCEARLKPNRNQKQSRVARMGRSGVQNREMDVLVTKSVSSPLSLP